MVQSESVCPPFHSIHRIAPLRHVVRLLRNAALDVAQSPQNYVPPSLGLNEGGLGESEMLRSYVGNEGGPSYLTHFVAAAGCRSARISLGGIKGILTERGEVKGLQGTVDGGWPRGGREGVGPALHHPGGDRDRPAHSAP